MVQGTTSKNSRKLAPERKVCDLIKALDHDALLKELHKQISATQRKKQEKVAALLDKASQLDQQLTELSLQQQAMSWMGSNSEGQGITATILNKKKKLQHEIESLRKKQNIITGQMPISRDVQKINHLFQSQKQKLQDERLETLQRIQNEKEEIIREYRLVSNTVAKHPHPWKPSKKQSGRSLELNSCEPNPLGKPFDFDGRSLWPVQPPRTGEGRDRTIHAKPWRAVPRGNEFGAPPLRSMSKELRSKTLQRMEEHERMAKRKEERLQKMEIQRKLQKQDSLREPWRVAATAPGQLFGACRPDRPLTYLERLRSLVMTTPDRVRYDPIKDSKSPWLPTKSGELFSRVTATQIRLHEKHKSLSATNQYEVGFDQA